MSIYCKLQKRIREIERARDAGKVPADKAAVRIAKLKARPPQYWVKGYAYGKWYDEPVPENGHSKKAAQAYDARIKVKVEDRTYTPAELLKVKLRILFEAHRDAMEGRGGHRAAKTRCKHATQHFGHVRLDHLHAKPKEILDAGFEALGAEHPEWEPKTLWQVRAFLRAAIGRYLSEHPKIIMNNPVDAKPMAHGTNTREVFPAEDEHQAVLDHLKANPQAWVTRERKGPVLTGFPAYLHALMSIKYEQGLRGMEIMPWRFENADLDCVYGRRPAIKTRILKQGKRRWQWVVLTPTAYRDLMAYLATVEGPKETGPIWPVKNWPTGLVRRLLDAKGLQHLVAHDWRRAWTMEHVDAPKERRRAAVGRLSEDESAYIHFNRQEQEALYEDRWTAFDMQDGRP